MRMKLGLIALALLGVVGGLLASATPSSAIVDGTTVYAGKYPFMASLMEDGSLTCGSTVVANTWVLTAAHCVADAKPEALSVRVGSNSSVSGGTVIGVDEIRIHPNVNLTTGLLASPAPLYDVALLKLHNGVPASVAKITLSNAANDNLEAEGTSLTVAGWGDITPLTLGLLAPAGMREVVLKVKSDANCFSDPNSVESASNICAAALLKDSCQGDSGGPLFWNNGNQRIQVGIVSNGFFCAVPGFPGTYTEVNNPSVRAFIHQYTGA